MSSYTSACPLAGTLPASNSGVELVYEHRPPSDDNKHDTGVLPPLSPLCSASVCTVHVLYLLYCTAVYRACTVSPVSFLLLLGCSHTGHVAAARLVKALLTADPLSTHYEPEDVTLPPHYHHGHSCSESSG